MAMPRITAEELFVFVGAGLSRSSPAGLPLFGALRDEILVQLGLEAYVPSAGPDEPTGQQRVTQGLAPEPFMLALDRGSVDVVDWLRATLCAAAPNAAHHAVARLAASGARVWTVNFDTLIEDASSTSLTVCSWPRAPGRSDRLYKPHGTLTGDLILTSEQVLRGLDAAWESQLRSDVRDRIAVFVGYSGRDLDFQPIWDDVLADARQVIWFELPAYRGQKEQLLRTVARAGRLELPDMAPPPATDANPSWAFVIWCRDRGLVELADDAVAELLVRPPQPTYPRLAGAITLARAAVQQVVGDIGAARRTYLWATLRGPGRRRALRSLGHLTINHGGRFVGAALAAGNLVPRFGGLSPSGAVVAHRKRVTILSNRGRHRAVLRLTRRIAPDDASTLLILRAAAVRMTGSLDEAAGLAGRALGRALVEQHPVRVAHAAFQRALALVWAGRLDEAEHDLHDVVRPYGALAASRWVAWADYVDAAIAIHRGDTDHARQAVDAGVARFKAEALVDGEISLEIVRLAVLRQEQDDPGFVKQRRHVASLIAPPRRRGTLYARGHRFTREAVALEDAEFARCHRGDLVHATADHRFLAASKHPLHAALGHLGLAMVDVEQHKPSTHAATAEALGQQVNARLIFARARGAAAGAATRPADVFFP